MEQQQTDRAVRVFVAAPALVCWGFERLLQDPGGGITLAGSAPATQQAIDLLPGTRADVVIADLDAGLDVAALCRAATCGCIGLTASDDDALGDGAVLAGLRGILRKNDAASTMLKAIRKVHEGELWVDRSRAGRIFLEVSRRQAQREADPARAQLASLTRRERDTVLAVARDASAPGKVLAGRLSMSEHTLRNHLSSVYGKLGLANRLDLYTWAMRNRVEDIEAPALRK